MSDETNPKRTTSDGRSRSRRRSDEKIRVAVIEILRASGPTAVTMKAVSAKSGVARTTLYRRYRDRFELIAGIANQVAPLDFTLEEPTLPGFTRMLTGMQDTFENRTGLHMAGQVLGSEEFLAGWRDKLLRPRLHAFHQFFARGVAAGCLREDVDYEVLVELLVGGVVVGSAFRGRLPRTWAEAVAAMVWPAIARQIGKRQRARKG